MKKVFCLIVLLATFVIPAFSTQHVEMENEDGDGAYHVSFEMNESFRPQGTKFTYNDISLFYTNKNFFNLYGQNYWQFTLRVLPMAIASSMSRLAQSNVNGSVNVKVENGPSITVLNYTVSGGAISFSNIDNRYIYALIPNMQYVGIDGKISLVLLPSHELLNKRLESVTINNSLTCDGQFWGSFTYTKDQMLNLMTVYSDMPKLEYSWTRDGRLKATAKDVPAQAINPHYTVEVTGHDFSLSFDSRDCQPTITQTQGNWCNMTFYIDHPQVKPGRGMVLHDIGHQTASAEDWGNIPDIFKQWDNPLFYQTIGKYYVPQNVMVEYDQWEKKAMVTWDIEPNKGSIETNGHMFSVMNDHAGTWYVLRTDNETGERVTVGSMRGSKNLMMEDNDLPYYDRTYTYRVVFMPDAMAEGGVETFDCPWLCAEQEMNTNRVVYIRLWQDRTEESGIKLVWEYNIKGDGLEFRLDKRFGDTSWQQLTRIPVDPNASTASYIDTDGITSPCDFFDYRVVVNCLGKEFQSEVFTSNLPSGTKIGTVTATKGTEESSVIVKWTVVQRGTDETQFSIQRRPVGETGDDSWTEIGQARGTASEYTFVDTRPLAGTYYEYSVVAFGDKCAEQVIQTDRKVSPGFSQARGTITGHISYGTGTSVQGVKVRLVKSTGDDQENIEQFLSRRIEGHGTGLAWEADSAKYVNVLKSSNPLTIQMWVMPSTFQSEEETNIFSLSNFIEAGVKNGHLCITELNRSNRKREFPDLTLPDGTFSHLTVIYTPSNSQLKFYVGTDTLKSDSIFVNNTWQPSLKGKEKPTFSVGGSNTIAEQPFNGYVDDIRLWKRALTERDIENNYTRILGGTEDELMLYWPLDEGMNVGSYAFDCSRQDGIYNENHAVVGINATPSIQTPAQLSLYGMTDSDGDYIVRGIPFNQGGTNYKIVPELGIHAFNPANRSLFVSPTSLTANNVDFEDASSFPMTGKIYYAGTNVPAVGIQFFIDGELVTKGGEVAVTDANGRYNISVPIGEHFVTAKLANHTMVNGGRFPHVGKYDFNRAVQYDFSDSTLVNFAGRIAGGEVNDTIPVGFAASKNNIGKATLKLGLNNESLSLNCLSDYITDSSTQRTFESDTTAINSTAYAGANDQSKFIFIKTDPATGEFSALLPPLKYVVKDITIDTNSDIRFSNLPEVDLTNLANEQTDSLKQEVAGGDSIMNYFKYTSKLIRTYYAEPKLYVTQKGNNNGAFGLKDLMEYEDEFGKTDITGIYTVGDDNTINYKYNYPIYNMGDSVRFQISGYETYINHDTSPAVEDHVPLKAQIITVVNEMSDDQKVVCDVTDPGELGLEPGDIVDLQSNQLILDANGNASYKWGVGLPNLVQPYTRSMHMVFERNGRTYLWDDLKAIVFGSLPTGNNFVTLGPDKVAMILRDPPGATSKTTWKRGSTKTKMSNSAHAFYGDEKIVASVNAGVGVETFLGLGLAVGAKASTIVKGGGGFHYNVQRGFSKNETWTITATENVSTGTTKDYVGSKGDVFIGASTNLLVGDCRRVGLFRENPQADFVLTQKDALSLGDSIRTTFMYSAYELETVMIPKWEELIKESLTHFSTQEEAEAYVNDTPDVIYVTWLNEDDPELGKDSTYIMKLPTNWDWNKKKGATDEVMWYYNQVKSWKRVLSANEYDKVTALKNKALFWKKNISFDGGVGYTYSNHNDTTSQTKHSYNHKLGVIIKGGLGQAAEGGGAKLEVSLDLDTENGWAYSWDESDYDENTKDYAEFEYSFSDGNKGTDFSVDIYESPSGYGDIFSVFGGQTYNPYHGEERTKWYEKGQHVLSNATMQMEQPQIGIAVGDQVAAKSAVITDVPAGTAAEFKLYFGNTSNVNTDFDFSYNLSLQEGSNPGGLEVFMDGAPASGRSIFVRAGETVVKTLTVRQTDQSILDHTGLEFWYSSQYQPLKIHDVCHLDVHFKPSSSPIDIAIEEPVLNTLGNDTLKVELKDFNRLFKNLKMLGVQYRYQGNQQWSTAHYYVMNRADSLNTSYNVVPPSGNILLKLGMDDDNTYPDGNYTFRAFTATPYDNNESDYVYTYSKEVNVVKDRRRPVALTTPSPANNILQYGDQLMVEFNEDIIPAYVSDKNVIITAKLNDQPVNHNVALRLGDEVGEARTVNPIFLNGDFSFDFWLTWHRGGTILQQGKGENKFTLGIDDEGHAVAQMAGTLFTSESILPKNKWIYFVFSYDSEQMIFSLLAQYDNNSVMLFNKQAVTMETLQSFTYNGDNYLYLNSDGLAGAIHDLCLYSIYRDVYEAGSEKYKAKDKYVYGLANYWPMNEGHGTVASDTRHTHDIVTHDFWQLDNRNFGLSINSLYGVHANITHANTGPGDSYAIELWAKGSMAVGAMGMSNDATLFETGKNGQKRLRLHFDKDKNLWLDYGTETQIVASHEDFPNYGDWNHYALNVVRGQAASFYYNGRRTAVISENKVPPIVGDSLKIGKGFIGYMDEIRLWNANLSQEKLLKNMYCTLDTADVYSRGLAVYFPFEHKTMQNGVETTLSTLENMAPGVSGELIKGNTTTYNSNIAPPLKSPAAEQHLIATPVASERKVVINLRTDAGTSLRDIEGTTLNITLDKIFDTHGNTSQPIKWTAYVQQNTLKWDKDSVCVYKMYGDDATFDVTITNKGGFTEYYSLCNMPQWLSLDGSSSDDEMQPLTTKTLRFRVDPMARVGNYDVTIGLMGNNEIIEPLRIVMKVRGEMPNWTVDLAKYDQSMNITGQVYVKGILMENSESRVAAFIDGECRGIAAPEVVRGATYVNMTIYGTTAEIVNGKLEMRDEGQPLSFRIWDASNGVAYSNVNAILPGSTAADTIHFETNGMIGSYSAPVIWTRSDNVEQTVAIKSGWNWISFGVEPVDKSPAAVFSQLNTWQALIKGKTNGVAYSNGTDWSGTLSSIEGNTMYKLQLTPGDNSKPLPETISVIGRQLTLSESPVVINDGWNWMPYTPTVSMSLAEALAGVNPQVGDRIKSQTGVAYYGVDGWEGNLRVLESTKAYLYYSTAGESKQFTFPAFNPSSPRHVAATTPRHGAAPLPFIFKPVDAGMYPDNMTMVVKLLSEGNVVDTCEVAAFIADECRAAARASNGLYYLIIAGQGAGQSMDIRTCLNDQEVVIDNSLFFAADANLGTPWEPYVIELPYAGIATGIGTTDTMSPGIWYTLMGTRIGDKRPAQPGVYIYNGRKVVVKNKKK